MACTMGILNSFVQDMNVFNLDSHLVSFYTLSDLEWFLSWKTCWQMCLKAFADFWNTTAVWWNAKKLVTTSWLMPIWHSCNFGYSQLTRLCERLYDVSIIFCAVKIAKSLLLHHSARLSLSNRRKIIVN
jgi:hypothetical protein